MDNNPMEFGELRNDTDFISKATNLKSALDKIDDRLSTLCSFGNYDDLSTEEKVKYDLFLSYTINSLFWMGSKLQTVDSNTNQIKNEISRVRLAMVRDKEIYDRKYKRPVLDTKAAARFIRHGLHEAKETDRDLLKPKKKKFY